MAEQPSLARSSLWAALSQLATTGLGGLAALVILLRFGKGSDTDAVFAAYGVYGILLVVCVSLRTSLVARLVEGETMWPAFDRFLGAGAALLLAAGAILVGAGGPLADLITGSLSHAARQDARWSLAILWLATGGQLLAGLGAAVLGIRDQFGFIGAAYASGGMTSIAGILILAGPVGILAVPTAIAAGSALTAAVILRRVRSLGYRPSRAAVAVGLTDAGAVTIMVAGSSAPVVLQLNFVVSVSFATRLGTGEATIYTTAFFAVAALAGITASALSLVLAAPVAQGWNRVPAELEGHLRTLLRAGLLVIVPILGVVAVAGDAVLDALLGSSFSPGDADRVVLCCVALSGFLVGTLAAQLPLLAAYALHRYRAVAAVSLAVVVVHVAATAVARAAGGVALLGVAASVSSLASMVLLMWLIHGARTPRVVAMVVGETALLAAICVPVFGAARLAGDGLGGGAAAVAMAAAAVVLAAAAVRALLPGHVAVARRMIPM
jgi:O-antigen/teichoic acid export membrane protein